MSQSNLKKNWLLALGATVVLLLAVGVISNFTVVQYQFLSFISHVFPPPLSQQQAVEVVQKMMNAKRQFYGPLFNRQVLAQVAVGEEYKKRSGTVDWLKATKSYYVYGNHEVTPRQFSKQGAQAVIEVNLKEEVTFYGDGKIDKSQPGTGVTQGVFRYTLEPDAGVWKVAKSEQLSVSP